jgi:hypothetical protein
MNRRLDFFLSRRNTEMNEAAKEVIVYSSTA